VVLNSRPGTLEDAGDLLERCGRETLENRLAIPAAGRRRLYVWRPPHATRTFLRVAFSGELLEHEPGRRSTAHPADPLLAARAAA